MAKKTNAAAVETNEEVYNTANAAETAKETAGEGEITNQDETAGGISVEPLPDNPSEDNLFETSEQQKLSDELAKNEEIGSEKPLILHAKEIFSSIYPQDTEEYNLTELEKAKVVLVVDKNETMAYFVKIADKQKAVELHIGYAQRYPYQEALKMADKLLDYSTEE